MVRTCRLLLVMALLCAASLHVQAKRIALVIGNDNYASVARLQKAGNDAVAISTELRAAGFEVLLHRDLDYRSMVKAVDTLVTHITGGDEVVFFFAGHGVQMKSGSYLLPVDIEATSETEVEKTSYALNDLMEQLGQAKAAFSLVMIDACRDNPLKSRGRNVGGTRGLNPPDPPKGQMIVYSASRGQQALDRLSENDRNPNGVFTREFVSRMRKPGVRVEDLVREVQDAVETLARSVSYEQRPALYNESRGSFYFFGPVTLQAAPARPAGPTEADREDRFWEDTKTAGNREGFEAYLEIYPKGRYASLARANISRLGGVPSGALASAPAAAPAQASRARAADEAAKPADPPAAAGTTATAPAAALSTARITLPNGDQYEGERVGLVRSGRGLYLFANGDRYEGQFADNLFNGEGVLTQANGDRYVGHFTASQPDGKGTQHFQSGDVYEGDFQRGIKQGQGVFRFANGDRYEGPFDHNLFSGRGKLTFANGDRYEGEFRNHLREGVGVLRFASGDRYEGTFVQGTQSGTGTYFYASGDRYEGAFAKGSPSGTGVYFYANGDKYTGSFDAGLRHGKGTYLYANGQSREFEFEKGEERTASTGGGAAPAAGTGS